MNRNIIVTQTPATRIAEASLTNLFGGGLDCCERSRKGVVISNTICCGCGCGCTDGIGFGGRGFDGLGFDGLGFGGLGGLTAVGLLNWRRQRGHLSAVFKYSNQHFSCTLYLHAHTKVLESNFPSSKQIIQDIIPVKLFGQLSIFNK